MYRKGNKSYHRQELLFRMVLNIIAFAFFSLYRKRLKHKQPEDHAKLYVIALILNEICFVFLCIFDIAREQ